MSAMTEQCLAPAYDAAAPRFKADGGMKGAEPKQASNEDIVVNKYFTE